MQRISVGIHDNGNGPGEIAEIRITGDNYPGCTEPYVVIHIGHSVDIFLTHERLADLRDKITAYIAESQYYDPAYAAELLAGDPEAAGRRDYQKAAGTLFSTTERPPREMETTIMRPAKEATDGK